MKIIHLTTVHARTDSRIFAKQCSTLAGVFDTTLVVADGLGPDTVNGVSIKDIGRPASRRDRMIGLPSAAAKLIGEEKPDIVHFHDPELIPLALRLQASGIKVIYDVHEDVPRDIMLKQWIPGAARKPLAMIAETFERMAARKLSGIVTVTPKIAARFPAEKTVIVKNLPMLEEFPQPVERQPKSDSFIYIGSISGVRGIKEMMKAAEICARATLSLYGEFDTTKLQIECADHPNWRYVNFHGFQDRAVVANALQTAKAGICTLWPTPTFKEAYPIKIFEYMSASLPVIASDFPVWREMLQDIDCAIFVDPKGPFAISDAMNWILDNPERAEEMGRNGRRAIESGLNWSGEAQKLISFYERLSARPQHSLRLAS